MSEMLKKPYEISVWEDELVTLKSGENYYKEKKLAIIGTDTMTSPSRVYSPILKENVNGEKTLTFQLQFKYFDIYQEKFITNPIYPLLINERKVKLFYNKKWYDFIIKEIEEDQDNNTFTYTAKDIFINELSKQGYNITFDKELNNNLGTITELAEIALKDTDWVVDKKNCDLLQQTLDEPLYKAIVTNDFSAKNLDTNKYITVSQGEIIYIFYSYVSNKNGRLLQFLREVDRDKWNYDDNDTIIGTNYRYGYTFEFDEKNLLFKRKGVHYIRVDKPYLDHKGYRLVYQQKTLFDPVANEYVDLFQVNYKNNPLDIYHYTSTEYSTSTLVQSIISGSTFELNSDKNVVGWDNMVLPSAGKLPSVQLATYPKLDANAGLVSQEKLRGMKSYLRCYFPNKRKWKDDIYYNLIFNSGLKDHASTIQSICEGEKYAFRIRCGQASVNGRPVNIPLSSADTDALPIQAYVALYRETTKMINGAKQVVKFFKTSDVIFNFKSEFIEVPNIISDGKFNNSKTVYYINGVAQAPSTKYYYKVDGDSKKYIWDAGNKQYVERNNYFLRYYLNTAVAKKTITTSKLSNPDTKIGIFICTSDPNLAGGEKYLFIEDIEIFKYVTDNNDNILLPGNVPEASIITKENYYIKPITTTTKDVINFFPSKASIADYLGVESNDIKRVYNNNSEKILSIEESHSNCFNILQTLCETFECWLKINVEHDSTGAIILDKNNKPKKKISFKEYVGKNNYAGFKYGINLNSISRSVDSNEVVTKLIVAESPNDYSENGTLSIAAAEANPTGESVIYNLDYYVQKGLITDKNQYEIDLNNLYDKIGPINRQIQNLSKDQVAAELALVKTKAMYNDYSALLEAARETYAKALDKFQQMANITYAQYSKKHKDKIDEALLDVVGEIYLASSVISDYEGVVTTAKQEYNRLDLECNGAKEIIITTSTTKKTETESGTILAKSKLSLNDYIEGFKFSFVGGSFSQSYSSSLNEKEFEVESDTPYQKIRIDALPKNYQISYSNLSTNNIYVANGGTYQIYDISNNKPLTRRFTLVPTSKYKGKYKGYAKRIEELVKEKNKYIKAFEQKYRHFIQEGTWDSNTYIDSNLYYLDAVQVSHTSAKPQVSYNINVTEISGIDDFRNYEFEIGDKTYIEDTDFFGWKTDLIPVRKENDQEESETKKITVYTPIKEEVILSEIEWNLDNPEENSITVQNYKTQFEDLFQRISATVQSVQYNEPKYVRAANLLNQNGQIDKKILAESLNGLVGESYSLIPSEAIRITNEGIIAKDLTNPKNFVRLIGKGIQASTDGGQTWHDLAVGEGIPATSLVSGTIDTKKITITNEDNTSFRWDEAGLTAYGFNEEEEYDLTSFVRMDKYGLYGIKNGDEYIVSSLKDVQDKAHFSLTWDGFRIKNNYGNGYVSISSDEDFEVVKLVPTKGNERKITKIKIGALEKDSNGTPLKYGININNDRGETVFTTGDDGNITITGTINAAAGNIGGFNIGDELFSGEFGEYSSIYLSPGHYGNIPVGGLEAKDAKNWVITAGSNFGVTSSGELYANNAVISGSIYADNGYFSGYVEARGGQFRDDIVIGNNEDKYIKIVSGKNGRDSLIASSDYIKNPSSAGWSINGTGDAIFNNISVRGAIKTAVFEYSEIEAVGGAFLFRPSSSIKTAQILENDVIVTVEKPDLFRRGTWVKTSNCNDERVDNLNNKLSDGGLTHVYKISNDPSNDKYIVLTGAGLDFTSDSIIDDTIIIHEDDNEGGNLLDTKEFIFDSQENAYYYNIIGIKTNNPQVIDNSLINNEFYYIKFQGQSYKLKAQQVSFSADYTDEDSNVISIIKKVIYLGNLGKFYSSQENTGEPFAIIAEMTNNEISNAKLYVETNEARDFIIQKIQVLDNNVSILEGGALIDMGFDSEDSDYNNGAHNYGIGINSSDNYINLPERAISLFETTIHPNASVKVTYDYKGILGTLPSDIGSLANSDIYQYMGGTQGIFTNNMYIGDANQYIAFYTDNHGKQLRIKANQVVYEITDEHGEGTGEYQDINEIETTPGPAGEPAITVNITSEKGNELIYSNEQTVLTCTVIMGMDNDITNQVTSFTWKKKDRFGVLDNNWTRTTAVNYITIDTSDVDVKAIFECEVEF